MPMKQETLEALNLLKTNLDNDHRVVLLKEKEKIMSEDLKANELSIKMKLASSKYDDDLNHFGFDSPFTVKSRQELHQIKLELDTLGVVKDYMDAFKEVRKLYEQIDEILFSSFKEKRKCK